MSKVVVSIIIRIIDNKKLEVKFSIVKTDFSIQGNSIVDYRF